MTLLKVGRPDPTLYERPALGTSFDEIHSGLRWYYERWLERSDLQFEIRMLLKEKSAEKGKEAFGALFDLSESGIREAASFVLLQDKRDDLQGIYAVINPSLRTDAPRGNISKKLTRDVDIIGGACYAVLVDIDPIRDPKEFNTWNATSEEGAWAHSAGSKILDLLPLEPNTIAHSGNGWQAVFPVEQLSKDDHSLILKWLDSRIQSDDYFRGRVKVDSAVCNPARVWRVIGTHGRKPGNGSDRPNVVKSVAIRPGADREDLPRMISYNQQELEALLAEIKSNDQKQASKIAPVARYVTEATQELPKKDGLKNGVLQVVETDSSWFGRGKAYAQKLGEVQPAISGQGGHSTAYAVVCKIVQRFPILSEVEHWELLNIYNQYCQPPWSGEELRHKLKSAQEAAVIHEPFTEANISTAGSETGVAVTVAPAAPEPWPELKHQENSLPEPREFPLDALPRTAKEFCLAVAEAQGCDPAFPGILSLACMAGAIGASHELMVKPGWTELPVFWLALIARPGTGKTPAANAVFAPLRSIQKRFTEEFRGKLSRYKSDLERRRTSKDGAMELPSKPARQTLLFQNITVESLVTELQNSPRGMVCVADELSFWVKSMNAYRAGGDREWFLSSWSSTPVDYFRKTSETAIYIPRPCVSICGSIQPAKLSLLHGGQDDGFLSRFLVCHPREVKARYSKEGLSVLTQRSWEDFIARLWNLEPEAATDLELFPRTVAFSPDAHDSFQNYFDRVQDALQGDSIPDILRGSWAKAPSVVGRLSLVIHLGKMVEGFGKCDEVSQKSVSQAIELSDYFLEHSTRLSGSFEQGQSSADKLRRSVLCWIERNRAYLLENRGFEWSKVRHDLRESIPKNKDGISDDRALEQALDGLEATGHIRAFQVVKPKKKPCYEINPLFLGSGSIHLSKYPPPPVGGFNQCKA